MITKDVVTKRTDRANQIIQKLEKTKNNFAKEIFELVKSRNPFSHERNFSNLWSMNFLLGNPNMLADAKEWTKKIVEMYKKEDPKVAEIFETFLGMLEDTEWMKKYRDSIHDKTFKLDKEHVNSYLILIVEYIKLHINKYIEFIKKLDEYEILSEEYKKLTEKTHTENFNHIVFSKSIKMELKQLELQNLYKNLERNISKWFTKSLAWMLLEMEREWKTEIELDWLVLKKEWMENIATPLLKYAEFEKNLLKLYEPILINLI